MDLLGEQWLSELEADGSDLLDQWQMKPINNTVNNLCFNGHSFETYSPYPSSSTDSIQESAQAEMAKSTKDIEDNDFSSYTKESRKGLPSASPNIISFGVSNSPKSSMHDPNGEPKCTVKTKADKVSLAEIDFSAPISPRSIQELYGDVEYGEPIKRGCNRTPLQAQDHVFSERKRRERLSERFVALSAIIPGLKKLDKSSVLGGAIKYVGQLEERIKMLEEEKRKYGESVIISSINVKRPQLASYSWDESSSSVENSDGILDQSSPEIEVRTSDTSVLVRVFCEKRSGIIHEILCEIEKLHLVIITSSVIPFGSTTLNITVIAQMERGVCMSAEDIANPIRTAIQKLM